MEKENPFEDWKDWRPVPLDKKPAIANNVEKMSRLFEAMEVSYRSTIATSAIRGHVEQQPRITVTSSTQRFFELYDKDGNRIGGISALVDRQIEPNSGFL